MRALPLRRSVSPVALLSLSLLACADPKPSRVVAVVDAEDLVRESTREVVVSVWGGESNPPGEDGIPLEETFVMRRADGDAGFEWPLRILLRPRDGRDRTYRIRVRAYDSAIGSGTRPPESFVAETRAVNRYARGEIRELRMLLIDECIGQMCEENQRCVARGVCEGLVEDPLEPPMDAGVPSDAATPECERNVDCDDENVCTDDSCVDGACVNVNNTATCSDGDACTSEDTCSGGVCVGGADPCAASGLTCEDGVCTGCTSTCPDVLGEWSACEFADDCAIMGTQTRTVTETVCTASECVPSGEATVQTQSCTRTSTDGASCGEDVLGEVCVPSGPSCGSQSGTRSVTHRVCVAASCMDVAGTARSCSVTVPCGDAGVDAGPRDAGRDTSVVVDDAGGPCPCMLPECEGRSCANGGSCGMQQCEGGETDCSNGTDDDLDALTDCDDPDCSCADAGAPMAPRLLITEYAEGSSFNKALELTNLGTAAVSLMGCEIRLYGNGSTVAGNTLALTGILAPRASVVYCHPSHATGVSCAATSLAINFSGDDALEVACLGVTVDTFGRIGERPSPAWVGGGLSSQDRTLRRKCSITMGDLNGFDPFDPSVEWDGFPLDTFGDLGTYSCPPVVGADAGVMMDFPGM